MDLGNLGDALGGLGGTAKGLGDAFSNLGGRALQAATGFDAAAGRFRNAQGQFQQAGSSLEGFAAGGMTKAGSALQSVAGKIKDLGGVVKTLASADIPSAKQAMGMLGNALGGAVTAGADKAAEALGKLGPAGQAAGAAIQGMAAVMSATIGVMSQFVGMAIESAQKADMMRDRFAALAGSAAAGKATQDMLGKLNLPFGPQVNEWAQALLAAGVKGKQLEADIKAIAAATALMGETGGAAAQTLFKRLGEGGPAADSLLETFKKGGPKADKLLKEMGLSIADIGGQAALAKMSTEELHAALSKAMQKKGAGPLADMELTLPVILGKARAGFMSLFGGLSGPVKAFMSAVKDLFGEFNKGSPIIAALKPIMSSVLTTVFGWLTRAAQAARELIQGFMGTAKVKGPFTEIGAAVRKVADAVMNLFTAFGRLNKGGAQTASLTTALNVLVVVIGAVADGVAMMIDNATMVITILGSLGEMASSVGGALSGMASGAIEAASNFVAGLVDGISAGAGAVVDAVKGLASGALSAFTGALGIKSPSTIMLEHGEENIAGAAAQGVEAGSPKMAKAMAKMGEAPPGTPKGKGASGGEGGGDGDVVFNDCHFFGVDEDKVRAIWRKIREERAAQAGG